MDAFPKQPARSAQLRRGDRGFARIAAAFFFGGFATFALIYMLQPLMPLFSHEFALSPAAASIALSITTLVMAPALIVAGSASEAWAEAHDGRLAVRVGRSHHARRLAPNWFRARGLRALARAGALRPARGRDGLPRRRNGDGLDRTGDGPLYRRDHPGGHVGRIGVRRARRRVELARRVRGSRRSRRSRRTLSRSTRCRPSAPSEPRLPDARELVGDALRAISPIPAAAAVRRGFSGDGRLRLHLQLHRLPARRAARSRSARRRSASSSCSISSAR